MAPGPAGSAAAGPRWGRRLRLSLRKRVFLLLALINVGVFAAGGAFAAYRLRAQDEALAAQLNERLGRTLRRSIRPEGDVNVARILQWPGWDLLADAILIDQNVESRPDGRLRPLGVYLNPLGGHERVAGFESDEVIASILQAMNGGASVAGVQGGWAVPIEGPEGVWGGCWYRTKTPLAMAALVETFAWGFVASTLLLTAGTFLFLRQLVLDPVDDLAEGARRVGTGDLSVRLAEPNRRDELADLVRLFNQMATTVEGFNARLAEEVQLATKRTRRAEQAAMTQRRLAAMGELAAGIAHEINNPLGGLQNAVDVLARDEVDPDRRTRYLALLRDGLVRIERTVGQLLRFTPRATATAPVDLVQVCYDALSLVRHRASKEGVALRMRIAGGAPFDPGPELAEHDLPTLTGSRNDLGQAVLNLLVNALDALGELDGSPDVEPRIDVELDARTDDLVLVVRDNGPGVAEGELDRVADLFHTTKEVGEGTGLGLSIVHNVVTSHGGQVSFASRPGAGFAAELVLPLAPASPSASDEGGEERE